MCNECVCDVGCCEVCGEDYCERCGYMYLDLTDSWDNTKAYDKHANNGCPYGSPCIFEYPNKCLNCFGFKPMMDEVIKHMMRKIKKSRKIKL